MDGRTVSASTLNSEELEDRASGHGRRRRRRRRRRTVPCNMLNSVAYANGYSSASIIGLRRCMLGTHCIDDSDLAETTRERPQSWWPTTHHTCMQPPANGCHCQSQHGASSDVW
ncbi:hypothetical protein BDA96_01G126400 [Sorghum bicolor]|uniref:Uncharacterized protein n=1 Tax=Sorghum bicolor TaxID=4558 RepID=A0A921RXF3_SORBI|nr:hypothetical protein BDA96_01G126400 [Sorghum bicolor]